MDGMRALAAEASPAALRQLRGLLRAEPALRAALVEAGVLPELLWKLQEALRQSDESSPARRSPRAAPPSDLLFTIAHGCDAGARHWARESGVLEVAVRAFASVSAADVEPCATALCLLSTGCPPSKLALHRLGATELLVGAMHRCRHHATAARALREVLAALRSLTEECEEVRQWAAAGGALDVICAIVVSGSDAASDAAGALANLMLGDPAVRWRATQLGALSVLPTMSLPGCAAPSADAVRAMFAAAAGSQEGLAALSAAPGFAALVPVFHHLMAEGAVDFAVKRWRNGFRPSGAPPLYVAGSAAVPFTGACAVLPIRNGDGEAQLMVTARSPGEFDVFAQVQEVDDNAGSMQSGRMHCRLSTAEGDAPLAPVADRTGNASGGATLQWRAPMRPRGYPPMRLNLVVSSRGPVACAIFCHCYDPDAPNGGVSLHSSCASSVDPAALGAVASAADLAGAAWETPRVAPPAPAPPPHPASSENTLLRQHNLALLQRVAELEALANAHTGAPPGAQQAAPAAAAEAPQRAKHPSTSPDEHGPASEGKQHQQAAPAPAADPVPAPVEGSIQALRACAAGLRDSRATAAGLVSQLREMERECDANERELAIFIERAAALRQRIAAAPRPAPAP